MLERLKKIDTEKWCDFGTTHVSARTIINYCSDGVMNDSRVANGADILQASGRVHSEFAWGRRKLSASLHCLPAPFLPVPLPLPPCSSPPPLRAVFVGLTSKYGSEW